MKELPEAWMGELVGRMHNAGIQQKDLAKEMNCTKAYVSMLLNGTKRPPMARERLETAFAAIRMRKENEAKEGK